MRKVYIAFIITLMWVSLISAVYASYNKSRHLIKVVEREGYTMELSIIGNMYTLHYVHNGRQLGISYWRTDHENLPDGSRVYSYISPDLLEIDPSLCEL